MGRSQGPAWGPLDAMSQKELAARRERIGTSLKVDQCDYCLTGNHGRCYGVVCRCEHEGWTRDPNAQVPHGMSAGGSKEYKNYYSDTDRLEGNRKAVGKYRNRKQKERAENYRLPSYP